jgi:hypothetical protein
LKQERDVEKYAQVSQDQVEQVASIVEDKSLDAMKQLRLLTVLFHLGRIKHHKEKYDLLLHPQKLKTNKNGSSPVGSPKNNKKSNKVIFELEILDE